jgi:hypothetical protein
MNDNKLDRPLKLVRDLVAKAVESISREPSTSNTRDLAKMVLLRRNIALKDNNDMFFEMCGKSVKVGVLLNANQNANQLDLTMQSAHSTDKVTMSIKL